ncbi:MAG TPA: hypothetical protein VLH84_00095 [Patescibacteria group bacterium]|nr:hypothetical protein [Patescibacteria group bacterium]
MAKTKKVKHKPIPKTRLFRWVGGLYAVCSVALIPWVIHLGRVLPTRFVSPHWHSAWVGLDVMLIVMLALSAWALVRRSAWVIMTTSIVGGMLLLDTWFDLLTSHQGVELNTAVLTAAFIEIPLASLSFWVAIRCLDAIDTMPRVRARIRGRLKPQKMLR